MAYVFLGIYILILIACYVAGSNRIVRANDEITEPDDSGIESSNPTA